MLETGTVCAVTCVCAVAFVLAVCKRVYRIMMGVQKYYADMCMLCGCCFAPMHCMYAMVQVLGYQ